MKKTLNLLSKYLKTYNLIREAQTVEEIAKDAIPTEDELLEENIKEFGSEPISEEDYAEQNFGGTSQDLEEKYEVKPDLAKIYYEIGRKEGFKIVYSGEGSSFVGQGLSGVVFKGIYQGKKSVIKIILNDSEDNDVDNWSQILKIIPSFPVNLKKHFPEIYHLAKGSITTISNKMEYEIQYQVVIMEELLQLPPYLKKILETDGAFGQTDEHKEVLDRSLKEPEYVYEIAKLLTDAIQNDPKFRFDMRKFTINPQEIFKVIWENKIPNNKHEVPQLGNKIGEYLLNKYPFREKYQDHLIPMIIKNLTGSFSPIDIPRRPENLSVPKEYHDYENYNPMWENIPETKEFYQALKLLEENGISWYDLHDDNIMMGQDGNFKIMDVGGFKNKS